MENKKTGVFDRTFGKLKIYRQILWSMVALAIVTTGLLGVTIFSISKRTMEDHYQRSHSNNLRVSSKVIDIQLKSIVEQGRQLLENSVFIQAFTQEQGNGRFFSSSNQQRIEQILSDLINRDPLIKGALVINEQGQWRYCSKKNRYSGYLNHYYVGDELLDEEWVAIARNALGKEVFYGFDVLLGEVEPENFSYVKNLINPATQKSMGFLMVSIDSKLLEQAFGKDKEGYSTNCYLLMKEDEYSGVREVVYMSGNHGLEEDILSEYSSGNRHKQYLFTEYHNSVTGWYIVNAIHKNEFLKDSKYIRNAVIAAMFLLVFVCTYLAKCISRRISGPLHVLEHTIQDVGEGNLRVEAEFDDSEIGRIGNQFKSMVNNNLELRDRLLNSELKEREAELLLLQSQINPHFLYNTLDSLYFMAVIEQADDIADMVSALSNTFKLSLNKGDKLITVENEIFRMKEYMKIQNFRYHDRFEFCLEVEEEILKEKILTFILQPVLENAIYHGLEPKIGNGRVSVTGYRDKEFLHFEISDNGVGVEDKGVLENGYGIRNIQERIELYYGEAYRAVFESRPGEGTTVTFVLPLIER